MTTKHYTCWRLLTMSKIWDWKEYYEELNHPEWGRKFTFIPFFDCKTKDITDTEFDITQVEYSLINFYDNEVHIRQAIKEASTSESTLVFHCNWEAPDFEQFPIEGEIKGFLEECEHGIDWVNILDVIDKLCQEYKVSKEVYLITAGHGVDTAHFKTMFYHINANTWFENYNHSFNYDLASLFVNTPPPGNAYHSVHWKHKTKAFNLLLGKPKPSRNYCMMLAKRHNLLERNMVSFNAMNHSIFLADKCYDSFSEEEKHWLSYTKQRLLDCEPLLDDNLYQNTFAIPGGKVWQQTLVSAVNEAMFTSSNIFLSEKTFRAIENFHPLVVIGQPGTLDILRQNNIDVFDDILDNSYDKIIEPLGRVVAVFQLLKDINNNLPDYVAKFNTKQVEHRLKMNYKYMQRNKKFIQHRYKVTDERSFVKRIIMREQMEDANDCPRYIWGL